VIEELCFMESFCCTVKEFRDETLQMFSGFLSLVCVWEISEI